MLNMLVNLFYPVGRTFMLLPRIFKVEGVTFRLYDSEDPIYVMDPRGEDMPRRRQNLWELIHPPGPGPIFAITKHHPAAVERL